MAASRIGWGLNSVAKILHRAGIATALALLCALIASPAQAQAPAPGVFTVRDVPVDATAENAAKAREVALSQGQGEALRRLLERLTPPEAHAALPTPEPAEVEAMVLGLSLRNEKTSNVRYLADLTVRFIPDAVTALLDDAQLPYVVDPAPAVVVLPLWRPTPESAPVLWDETNPWHQAWTTLPRGGLQPVEAPLGDLEDIMAADAAAVAQAQPEDLRAYADRYGTAGVMIAEATRRPGTDGQPPTIEASATTDDGARYSATVSQAPDEGEAAALHRAALALRDRMEADWKSRQAIASAGLSGQGATATVLVPIGGMHDWLSVRRALNEARGINAWTLQALTRDRAQVSLSFRGDIARLSDVLAPYGLTARQESGYWVIDKAASGAPRAQAGRTAPDHTQNQRQSPSPSRQQPPSQGTVTIQ